MDFIMYLVVLSVRCGALQGRQRNALGAVQVPCVARACRGELGQRGGRGELGRGGLELQSRGRPAVGWRAASDRRRTIAGGDRDVTESAHAHTYYRILLVGTASFKTSGCNYKFWLCQVHCILECFRYIF